MGYVTNLDALRAWAVSDDGADHGRSTFSLEYSDGRTAPVVVEREGGAWRFWSGHGWSSPSFRTRHGAAYALFVLVEEFERKRVRQSGLRLKFDARAVLRARGLK